MCGIHTAAQEKRGSWTHLSAHGTVDCDDNKTLDGVKDGKEDLEETHLLLALKQCQILLNYFFLKDDSPSHPTSTYMSYVT